MEHLEQHVNIKSASYEVIKWAFNDNGPWDIQMSFIKKTEDGELKIRVGSHLDMIKQPVGYVIAIFGSVTLADYYYVTSLIEGRVAGRKVNKHAAAYIRCWVRQRVLPELEIAIVQRDADSINNNIRIESLRKKYSP